MGLNSLYEGMLKMRRNRFESKADFYKELLSMLPSCDCEEIANFVFDVYCDMPQDEEGRLGFNEQDKDTIETLMIMDAGEEFWLPKEEMERLIEARL